MKEERERISSEAYRENWRATGRAVWSFMIAFATLIAAIIMAAIIKALTGNGTIAVAIVTIAAGAMVLATWSNPLLSVAGLGPRALRIVSSGVCTFFGLATIGSLLPPPENGRNTQAAPSPVPSMSSVASTSPSPAGLRRLPPAKRFEEYGPSDRYRHAQDLLNAGEVEDAYNLFEDRNRTSDGPREKRFDVVLEQAFQQSSRTTPGSDFAERVNTYWLPQARAISDKPPSDDDGWHKIIGSFNELAADASQAEAVTLSRSQRAAGVKLLSIVGAKQAALYPAFRRHLASTLDAEFFRAETRVSASGPSATTIELVSVRFASNSNIADLEQSIEPSLLQARFRKVVYRWARGAPPEYYTLKPPADRVVALWNDVSGKYSVVILGK